MRPPAWIWYKSQRKILVKTRPRAPMNPLSTPCPDQGGHGGPATRKSHGISKLVTGTLRTFP
eukprot:6856000-Pyramimonas_sp.AAC.1